MLALAATTATMAQQGEGVIMHKVEKGQTLFAIARKYGASVAEIRALNGDLKDGLQVDQMIKIPAKGGKATPAKAETLAPAANAALSADAPVPAGTRYHTVGAGQTLSMIARTYKVSVPDILKWNNLSSPKIDVGQKVVVSGAVDVPAQNATAATKAPKANAASVAPVQHI